MVRSSLFFNDTATTEIYTLSLHDALPIYEPRRVRGLLLRSMSYRLPGPGRRVATGRRATCPLDRVDARPERGPHRRDRKSTRLNSSHANISYAVFCLKQNNSFMSLMLTLA